MMIEYNHTIAVYEDQLLRSASPEETFRMKKHVVDLSAEVKRFQEIEEENVQIVARAEKIRPRMLQAESDLQKLEVDNADLRDKFSKSKYLYMEALEKEQAMAKRLEENEIRLQLLEKNRGLDLEKAKREGRVTSRDKSRDLLTKFKDHLVTFDQHTLNAIYAAEVKANRVMLGEILDEKISDLKAELEILRTDEKKALKNAAEVSLVKIDHSKIDPLLADTPSEVVTEILIPPQDQVIIENQFGSNLL